MSFSDLTRIAEDPNILKLIMKYHSTEKCYLVLQYAKDDTLRTYLQNNFEDLDWKTKINMAQDITNGLCYMHEENIVHRDLISSGRPPDLEITSIVMYGKRETPINGIPEGYIKIYSNAWKDNPEQRPTIEEIRDSLIKDIQLENIYNSSNENNQHIQIEEPTLSLNSYDQNWLNNELKKYGYNFFENFEEISESIHNATLMNGKMEVTLKSIAVNSMELFVNEYSDPMILEVEGKFSRTKESGIYSVGILLWEISSGKIPYDSYCWNQDPNQRPNIEKVIQDLEHVETLDGLIDESMRGHVGNISDENFDPLFSLIDRIEVAEHSTKSLRRKKQENAEKFSDEKYYRAWVIFTNVLKNIKDFAEDVTQLSMFRKYLNANAVKEAYDKNIEEFDAVCKDLQFSFL
ncbi:5255_t:CDS:2 [Diversispora eburnea]|uniref:5255_t:CDS:1 n=1 Tax=Diversispora eburnea TaxID=1213867 RepID=A0A9N8ZHG6_9GLOM|nr:5255_t:CDS:2 [Diversispora eburnea]